MCDYDGGWQHITDREVARTRTAHECGSCAQKIPAGSRALFITGKYEGQIGSYHACMACQFCAHQPEHSPLHVCWGDLPGMGEWDDAPKVHAYVHHCIENGETPTATGLEGALRQHHDLDALEIA